MQDTLKDKEELNKEIYNKIQNDTVRMLSESDGLLFDELEQIEDFCGDQYYGVPSHNLIFWTGMSHEAVEAINDLYQSDVIEINGVSMITYLVGGKCLTYPLAKSIRKYKDYRWIPVEIAKGHKFNKFKRDKSGTAKSL